MERVWDNGEAKGTRRRECECHCERNVNVKEGCMEREREIYIS